MYHVVISDRRAVATFLRVLFALCVVVRLPRRALEQTTCVVCSWDIHGGCGVERIFLWDTVNDVDVNCAFLVLPH